MAPGIEVKPPRITTGSAFSATCESENWTPSFEPQITPATSATSPATLQTITQMRLSGMPIDCAAWWSSATARSARPVAVFWKKNASAPTMIAAVLVALLALFFQKTATGRALRAVADDHQAAQSIGIPLDRIWVIVWAVAGVVALVAGVIWGSKLGVQFSLSLVALKALPVVILGGLTSIPGAIIGGLVIGVGEKLSEIYLGPMLGGGIEIWFAYVLALAFLLVRPQGLFGEKIIDRV